MKEDEFKLEERMDIDQSQVDKCLNALINTSKEQAIESLDKLFALYKLQDTWRTMPVMDLVKKVTFNKYGVNVIERRGNTNTAAASFELQGQVLSVYICHKGLPCGHKQLIHFMFKYIISGTLMKECQRKVLIKKDKNGKIQYNNQISPEGIPGEEMDENDMYVKYAAALLKYRH